MKRKAVFASGVAKRMSDGHGEDRAGADAHAIDRRDDRLAAMEHRFDEVAGHTREGEQPLHVHPDERPDDVMHIAAGGKVAAVRGEHDGLHIVGLGKRAKRIAKLRIAFEGERVLPLRPVERDHSHRALHAEAEMGRLEISHLSHAPLRDRDRLAGRLLGARPAETHHDRGDLLGGDDPTAAD